LDQEGNFLCDLPDIPFPYGRFGATMEGNILCGGYGGVVGQNCIYYNMGSWINPKDILNQPRYVSSSWGRPNPNSNVEESHIYGGYYSPHNTSEIANTVDSNPSYNYIDGNYGQCTIQFDNYVVITGGFNGFVRTVAAYDENGNRNPLPSLVEGRAHHGCGHYIDGSGDMVYLVTGGVVSASNNTVTTELSINEGPWSTVSSGDLPTPRHALKGISLNNQVFMTGGWEWDSTGDALGDVLQWDISSQKWILKSSIMTRFFHSVSVLPWNDVEPYCIYGKKKRVPKLDLGYKLAKLNADGIVEI